MENHLISDLKETIRKHPQSEMLPSTIEKQILFEEIKERWGAKQGKLEIYCKRCNLEMGKQIIQTPEIHRMVYLCPNFPRCPSEAIPFLISGAILNNDLIHRQSESVNLHYEYNEILNRVYITPLHIEKAKK